LKIVKNPQRIFAKPGKGNDRQSGDCGVDQHQSAAQPQSPVNHFLLDGGKDVGMLAHSWMKLVLCNAARLGAK
jgi:hypothetical protein